ncbi:MAG: ATP-binding cassette domain-containing protein [Salinivirgaceae bacterium]|nr:ATP-binding cassette domain-containing protein [Salinivirgaceae bacterium]
MSEPILIALVQLFAIIAASRHTALSANTRLIIEGYLKQYLSTKELEEYLLLFDELFLFHDMSDENYEWGSTATLDKMAQICDRINKGLQQKDKLTIFIKFIEFVEQIKQESSDTESNEKSVETKYYKILQVSFNISNVDYSNIFNSLIKPNADLNISNKYLIICAPDNIHQNHSKTIHRNHLNGEILVHYFKSVELFIGKYYGTDDLYLNGHYIPNNQSFIISPGSILKNQKINPVYYADVAAKLLYIEQQSKIEFIADQLAFNFKNSQNGIQPFSFASASGELIGIIGGSGAGKSTLLGLFNGSIKPKSGHLYINGHDLNQENENLKKIIGYIPQDDLLIDELTVFQNLYYNAKLCYRDFSNHKLIRIILKILHDVDLMDIRDLVVGNPLNKIISGGQRKRLNIALELLREPYLLFADEPTSGLSSLDSEMVMLLLKEQTLKGRMVMVNIHQPSTTIFKLFDKLLFLDKGGYPIYYGNPIDSISYFKTANNHVNASESECLCCGYVNPEQLFQITEAKTINKHGKVTNQRLNSPQDWYEKFQNKIQPKLIKKVEKLPLPENKFNIPSKFNQFKIFSLRNLFIKITNKQYILLNLLEAPFLALILAYLTRYSSEETYFFGQNKNTVAYMFMSVVVALFIGMMVSAEEIIKDRKIMKREAFLSLSRFSYINSKVFFLIALSAIQALLYVLVGNYILGIKDMLFSFWLILFSTSCFANFVGLNISSALNSVVNIYILIPFFLVPQLLLSGVIVPFDTLNSGFSNKKEVPLVGDLMASRWAFEALAVTQFTKNEYASYFYEHDKNLANYTFISGYKIPALKSILDECHRNVSMNKKIKSTVAQLKILNHEISLLQTASHIYNDTIANKITIDYLNDEVHKQANRHLKTLSKYFASLQRVEYAKRDETYKELAADIGDFNVLVLKQKHYNESLADWLLDRRGDKKLVLTKNGFVRKKDPVYFEPDSRIGRAHFYAPVKKISSLKIDTLWFNLAVLWLMSFVLYLTLLNKTLKRLLVFFENLSFKKKAV